jgi:hypothetical protein
MNEAKTREVIADNFIKMLIEGPLVSFRGSPTVSPTTAALCSSVETPYEFFFLKIKGVCSSDSNIIVVLS